MYDLFYIGTKDAQYENLKQRFSFAKIASSVNDAQKKSFTKMLWVVYSDLIVSNDFNFDYQVLQWDESYIHVFKNGEYYDGVALLPKKLEINSRELEYRFFRNKKEIDIVASTPASFEVVFISYNELNADKNYQALKTKAPNAKRVDGVKGIHQAHIEAAKLVSSNMFWVVDADAVLEDSFKFDYQVSYHNQDMVHVWSSCNPINNLKYGYGGVKLLPRLLTLNMNLSKPDMTTSISDKFKIINEVSNTTAFNTDPFSTWRSAFRECAKLASGTIKNSDPDEALERLEVWCSTGADKLYGDYCLDGATQGQAYGFKYSSTPDKLALINDFAWLTEQFNNDCKVRS